MRRGPQQALSRVWLIIASNARGTFNFTPATCGGIVRAVHRRTGLRIGRAEQEAHCNDTLSEHCVRDAAGGAAVLAPSQGTRSTDS